MNAKPGHLTKIAIAFILFFIFLTACRTIPEPDRNHLPRFHIESYRDDPDYTKSVPIVLPISGSMIRIKPIPTIASFQLQSVSLKEGREGKYLEFVTNGKTRFKLMSLSHKYRGRRLILQLGEKSIGSWRISRILQDGFISIYVEIPDENLPEWVEHINIALESSTR